MARDAKLNILLTLTDKASKGIEQFGSNVSGLPGALGGIGRALGGVAVGAGLAGVAVAGALTRLAVDAAPLQNIQDAFTGITSGAGLAGDEIISSMRRATFATVPNVELMRTFNEAAQLVGVEFAQTLPDAMESMGKVASATGQDVGFLLDSYTRGIARLSPAILDNLSIQVDMQQAFADWAEENDRAVDSMTKAEQQAALAAQVNELLAANTANIPSPINSATVAMDQFKTATQNLKDQIGMALLPVLTPLMQRIADMAQNLLPVLVSWFEEKAVPALSVFGTWLGENIPAAMDAVKQFWDSSLKPALETLAEFIQTNVSPVIADLAAWWSETLWPALQRVWEFLSVDMLPIWTALADLFAARIEKTIEVISGLWENVLLPALLAVWEFLSNKFGPIWEELSERFGGLEGIIQTVADKIQEMADALRNIELPDWLTPGSPTPFELGLLGIDSALRKVQRTGLPDFTTGINVSRDGVGLNGGTTSEGDASMAAVEDLKVLIRNLPTNITSAMQTAGA